ncbi:MAG: hypothetical protein ABI462_12105 [Ignavibacteria bacterium]
MKTFILFSVIILSQFFSYKSYSQDTSSARYFPLQVGNIWVYDLQTFPPIKSSRVYSITKDTIINDHKYFFYRSNFSGQWIRYDSSKGNLVAYSSTGGCSNYNNDRIIDSLPSGIGDLINCQLQAYYTRECMSISTLEVFSVTRDVKRFEHDGLVLQYVDYAKDIGIIWTATGEPPPANNYEILRGCVINGKVYGDTMLTSVKKIGNIIPEEYTLHQNYPNPFNPNTIINYTIPSNVKGQRSKVKLIVYDALGKEIKTLVNEAQTSGSYTVDFNGRIAQRDLFL